jgi:hypothetical protein
MENQNVLTNPTGVEDNLQAKAKAFEGELDQLAETYGVNILAAVSFRDEDQTGVFFSGEQNLITELGLAKVIENKFRN